MYALRPVDGAVALGDAAHNRAPTAQEHFLDAFQPLYAMVVHVMVPHLDLHEGVATDAAADEVILLEKWDGVYKHRNSLRLILPECAVSWKDTGAPRPLLPLSNGPN